MEDISESHGESVTPAVRKQRLGTVKCLDERCVDPELFI